MTLRFHSRERACFHPVSNATERKRIVSKTVSAAFPSRFPFPALCEETGNEGTHPATARESPKPRAFDPRPEDKAQAPT